MPSTYQILNKKTVAFFLNEVSIRLYPFIIFGLPYFFYSKRTTGEISYTLSIFMPLGVYLIGNIKQESMRIAQEDINVINFINEKIQLTILFSIIISTIIIFFFNAKFSIILWKSSDLVLEILLISFFIEKKYYYLLFISFLKIVSFAILFFLLKFLNSFFLLFYLVSIVNLIIIVPLILKNGFTLHIIKINNSLINVIGLIALIDSIVVQIPKYFLKLNDHYEAIADFTIYFYLVFPIGLLMESLSLILLKVSDAKDKAESKKIYYYTLLIISGLILFVIWILYYFNIYKIDYISALFSLLFGIVNYALLHMANYRIVSFDNKLNLGLLMPYLIYLITMVLLSYLNFNQSIHTFFLILIISCLIKWIFIKNAN